MNEAEPIRDQAKIEEIKQMLQDNPRDYLLFVLGINSALRGGDLRRLQVGDVRGRRRVSIQQTKTGRKAAFTITKPVQRALDMYFAAHPQVKSSDYLFYTTTHGAYPDPKKHLSRSHVTWLVRKWCFAVGLQGSFGSHTLRKT